MFGAATIALFVMFFSMVFIARQPLGNPDTWWHLVMGHAYLDGTSVRHPGPMSPLGTEDWRSRDWLSQVLMALFDDAFGLPGVAWLLGLALVVLFIACFRLCRRLVPFGPAVVATGLAFFSMIGSLSPRPQVVSFILLVVTLGALLRTAEDLRPRWWLAALTAVWACSHGLWFLSPGLQLVFLLGLVMDRRLGRKSLRPHVLLLGVSVAAVALTPNGVHLLTHPTGPSMDIAHYIQEYEPTSLSFPPYAAALLMGFVVCLTWARRGNGSWLSVMLVGLGIFLALYGGRTIPLGAILLAPFFARAINTWWPKTQAFVPLATERVVVYGSALAALVALALMVPSSAAAPDDYFPTSYDSQLSVIPDDAVLINELGDGGYLAWKYPDLRIVGDGLTDQYSVEWLESWFKARLGEPGWDEFVQRSGADYALLDDSSPLRLGLMSLGWSIVQEGQDRVLLTSPDR
ncbi:hypothetical protein ACFQO6_21630 [Nocardioides astragali]|uniref:Glycosyltransferase RgtA/B/C/D-like domain-containing protein n=2 Tax=Nocardioides astragali TaxID=1776736 RepID=A0ABW2NDB3_9ACTN